MKDTDWLILYELKRTPNITKVASQLYMSQPALTKRIQYMENEFGVRILNRSTKGVHFTKEGEYLASQAEGQVRFMEGIHRKFDEYKNVGYGTIRIAASYTYGKYQLPAILRQFQRKYPDISFDILSVKSDEMIRLVQEGIVDVCFMRGEYSGDLELFSILEEYAYAISAKPFRMEELPELPRVDCVFGRHTRTVFEHWWGEHYSGMPQISATIRDVDAAWEMVKEGLGYTICFFTKEQLEAMNLYSQPLCDEEGAPLKRNTLFGYAENHIRSSYIRVFIEDIKKYYRI